MRCLVATGLVFLISCSSSNEESEKNSSAKLAECASNTYSVTKSEFFGDKAYSINPMPAASQVVSICDASTEEDLKVIGSVCEWARRKLPSDGSDIGNASYEAYWTFEAAQAITAKLNQCG